MKPIRVGITTGLDGTGFVTLRPEYVRAVEAAGAIPFLIAPGPVDRVVLALDHVDGLLLSGGSDMDPALYGEAPHPATSGVNRLRDDAEIALCREAVARDMPVLAICRGQQVLNVALGGTLVQDIPWALPAAADHRPKDVDRWHLAHDVEVLPGTTLRAILGQERCAVNSFHHQSIDRLGADLRLSARSTDDGVVEAVEMPDRRFVVGVQWHPEALWNRTPSFQALFEAWVRAAEAQ